MGASLSIMSIDLPFRHLDRSRDPRSSVGVAFSQDVLAITGCFALGLNALLQRRGPRIFTSELKAQKESRADPPFPLYAYKGKAEAMASLRESKEG